jgi:hypothetical protein
MLSRLKVIKMKLKAKLVALLVGCWLIPDLANGEHLTLLESATILRSGDVEWEEFKDVSTLPFWETNFQWNAAAEAVLEWTQYDVKQTWEVAINGKSVGSLVQDENRMSVVLPLSDGILQVGTNSISVKPTGNSSSDDVKLEQIVIRSGKAESYLREAVLRVEVRDRGSGERTPARISLLRMDGALAPHGLSSGKGIAARCGTIYTLSGMAHVPVPAGQYRVYAGRGFEYSLAAAEVKVGLGESVEVPLQIEKAVDTTGFAACDTHIHTLTHSGHGDATIEDRMVTIAGEGIELAIATDHNKYIDYEEVARDVGARSFFTPMIGCEVTTPRGHFNVFPIAPDAKPVSHEQTNWKELFADIRETPDVGVIILNHARDLHSGVRPFAIENHFASQGENAMGWEIGFNAMEILNSAATQSDVMQLTHDWMALLNSGKNVVPIGCSDSHDVARHFVGQGRTYIRCDDRRPESLPLDACIKSLANGQSLVSYGVFVRLIAEGRYQAGDLALVKRERPIKVTVEAQTPNWINVDQVQLYVNGELIEERSLGNAVLSGAGKIWQESFEISPASFDAHVVAIVTGPGIEETYWRCAKPYQPTTSHWRSRVFGCSGAVWLDRDANGKRNSAREYAAEIIVRERGDLGAMVAALQEYDRAVAIQVFSSLNQRGVELARAEVVQILDSATEPVKDAYRSVMLELRNHALSREIR